MLFKTIVPALAGLAMVAGTAFAQATPPAPPPAGPMMHMRHFDKADMQKHLVQMCQDRYAGAVGQLAELETKLNLTAMQKPLFERWRESILTPAKAHVAECTSFKPPEGQPSVVDHVKMQQKMLQAHLDILKAQMPALEALNASLNADQQKTFGRAAMKVMMHDRMGMMRGMRGNGRWMHRGDDGDRDRDGPPPADD